MIPTLLKVAPNVILKAFYPLIPAISCLLYSDLSSDGSAYIFINSFKLILGTRGKIIFIHFLCSTLSYSLTQSIRLARYYHANIFIFCLDFTVFAQFYCGKQLIINNLGHRMDYTFLFDNHLQTPLNYNF